VGAHGVDHLGVDDGVEDVREEVPDSRGPQDAVHVRGVPLLVAAVALDVGEHRGVDAERTRGGPRVAPFRDVRGGALDVEAVVRVVGRGVARGAILRVVGGGPLADEGEAAGVVVGVEEPSERLAGLLRALVAVHARDVHAVEAVLPVVALEVDVHRHPRPLRVPVVDGPLCPVVEELPVGRGLAGARRGEREGERAAHRRALLVAIGRARRAVGVRESHHAHHPRVRQEPRLDGARPCARALPDGHRGRSGR